MKCMRSMTISLMHTWSIWDHVVRVEYNPLQAFKALTEKEYLVEDKIVASRPPRSSMANGPWECFYLGLRLELSILKGHWAPLYLCEVGTKAIDPKAIDLQGLSDLLHCTYSRLRLESILMGLRVLLHCACLRLRLELLILGGHWFFLVGQCIRKLREKV